MSIIQRYPHLAAHLFDVPLMVLPNKLDAILHGIGHRFGIESSSLPEPMAYTTTRAERTPSGYRVQSGVALIDVFGVLTHRSMGIDANSDPLTSYQSLAHQLDTALADPAVHDIVMQMDSPGGEVSGVFQLAESIYQGRSVKPIHAVVSDLAASACYLLSSACTSISVSETSLVGSIGVVMRHIDVSQSMERQGVKVTHLYAGDRKIDGNPYQPLTDEVAARFQEQIDHSYQLFVNAVAKYRGLLTKDVIDTQAGVFTFEKAMALGLVDRLATTDQLMKEYSSQSMEFKMEHDDLEKQLIVAKATITDLQAKEQSLQEVISSLQSAYDALAVKLAAETERADKAQAELAEQHQAIRQAKIKSLLEELDLEASDSRVQTYMAMDDGLLESVATDLRAMKPSFAADLLKEVAVSGAENPRHSEHDLAAQLFAQVAGGK